ncbi:hypothetical protein BKA70DRAFT_180060 [Coprinopsis sp. MPI-PUGE-AT-0042]|nr:hypothetical protein BKA70DRAFT_180060 [Coprinopsis sp. MPI-PUGE-AT-0042]
MQAQPSHPVLNATSLATENVLLSGQFSQIVDEAYGGSELKPAERVWGEARLMALFSILSLILVSTAFIAFGGLVLRVLEPRSVLDELQSTAILLHLLCYSLLMTISLIVIYAIYKKSSTTLSWCCAALFGLTLFAIGSGALCLTLLFNPPGNAAEQQQSCLAANGPFLTHFCKRDAVAKGTTLSLLIGSWLLDLLAWYAANRFAWHLNDTVDPVKPEEACTGDAWDRYYV